MGSYLTIVNDTDSTWYVVVGSDQAALMVASIITTSVAAIASGGLAAGLVGGAIIAGTATAFVAGGVSLGATIANASVKLGQIFK